MHLTLLLALALSIPAGDEKTLLVDDFNGGPDGPSGKCLTSKISIVSKTLKATHEKKGAWEDSAGCLKLTLPGGNKGKHWARIEFRTTIDTTPYKSLSFWTKGAAGGEAFKAYLKATSDPGEPAKDARPLVTQFMEGKVTTEWKRVLAPLNQISSGIDTTQINMIMLEFRAPEGATAFIDEIRFTTEAVKLPEPPRHEAIPGKVVTNELSGRAKAIVEKSGIRGGLIVHYGIRDGKLTAALRINDHYVVHGLDKDPAAVDATRAYFKAQDLQEWVTADLITLKDGKLPYIDNLVNLFVSDDIGATPKEELLRVLCPNGVAIVNGETLRKPYPKELGDWQHLMCSAGRNSVAQDTVIAQPRHLQWKAGREWDRQHDWIKSLTSMVSARGRVFYNIDDATSVDMYVPPKWSLVARDAFNGTQLWKRPLIGWSEWGGRGRYHPHSLHTALAADPQRDVLYTWMDRNAAVSALDAATGETLMTYPETAGAEVMVILNDTLFVISGDVNGEPKSELAFPYDELIRRGRFPNRKTLRSIDSKTGKILWSWKDSEKAPFFRGTLSAHGNGVYVHSGEHVIKFERRTGKQLWKTKTGLLAPLDAVTKNKNPKLVGSVVAVEGFVLNSALGVSAPDSGKAKPRTHLYVLDATTGSILWKKPGINGNPQEPGEIFVIDNVVWFNNFTGFTEGFDIKTGEVARQTAGIRAVETEGHHDRCYRAKATLNYILGRHRGLELIDVTGGENHSRNNWARGICRFGVMPANGLIYLPPHSCACYMEAKLYGLHALGPRKTTLNRTPVETGTRLVKGPAYGASQPPSELLQKQRQEWPAFRQNPTRSGSTSTAAPESPKNVRWTASLGGNPTPPVIANGKVFVAQIDKQLLVALDATSGQRVWEFTAGGRIDSPPAIYGNLALFGCRDGWVYCLRESDGALVWKFLGAPEDQRTMVNDILESVWPIHGSVLIQDHTVYFTAGRNTYLDHGIYLWGLDPVSGRIRASHHLVNEHPNWNKEVAYKDKFKTVPHLKNNFKTFKTVYGADKSDAFAMEGATNDVMVSDGISVFLRHRRFDTNLKEVKERATHLYSTSSLLDREGNHRSAWVLGSGDMRDVQSPNHSWLVDNVNTSMPHAGKNENRFVAPVGRILTYDDQKAFVIQQINGQRPYFSDYWIAARSHKGINTGKDPGKDLVLEKESEPIQRLWTTITEGLYPISLVKAGDVLVVSGTPTTVLRADPWKYYEGRGRGLIWYLSSDTGKVLSKNQLPVPPIWDGVAIARGRIIYTGMDGSVRCVGD